MADAMLKSKTIMETEDISKKAQRKGSETDKSERNEKSDHRDSNTSKKKHDKASRVRLREKVML